MKLLSALLLLPVIASLQTPDPVKERLDKSPRHHEWVDVKHGERAVTCFVAYPETKAEVAAVIVIHENKGLTDWVRAVADRLAEAGYIAIAPDLLSGMGPNGARTDGFASADAATQAIYKLDAKQVTADLDAVADYVTKLDACDGKLSVAGFCWGGSQSFAYATQRRGLKGAFVFYGSAPTDEALLAKIECPVYGFYGESDARIGATLPATSAAMTKLEKKFEPVSYAGAGHGFLRAGEASDATEANKKACAEAWTRWKKLLSGA